MDRKALLDAVENINIWKKHSQRAPHKPLLILYALGRFQTERSERFEYEEIKDSLKGLLIDFGPNRESYDTKDPFVRLQRDGIWHLSIERDSIELNDRWLLNNHVTGGFNSDVLNLIKQDDNLIREIAENILDSHFPESIHEDILCAVGLDLSHITRRVRKRDPKFREKILRAYGYSCAVCGFNIRMAHQLVGVEAAHIKWHQAGGPDIESNGLALCSMHHKLFDHGVFTINNDRRFIVSQNANGSNGLNEWLMQFHGKEVRGPIQDIYVPNEDFLHWHVKEVFKGDGRY